MSLSVPPVPSGPSWRAAAGRVGYADSPGPKVGAPLCLNRATATQTDPTRPDPHWGGRGRGRAGRRRRDPSSCDSEQVDLWPSGVSGL